MPNHPVEYVPRPPSHRDVIATPRVVAPLPGPGDWQRANAGAGVHMGAAESIPEEDSDAEFGFVD